MYKTCPECGYEKPPVENLSTYDLLAAMDNLEVEKCPACGLVYKKWLKAKLAPHIAPEVIARVAKAELWPSQIRPFLFPQGKKKSPLEFSFYLLLFLVLVVWGWSFVTMEFETNEIGNSFLHNINLVFHEAGHVLFQPFGRLMMFLGGSLFQVLLPLILVFAFLAVNKDGFGASVCLWWTGQSLMDIAPYIADARALRLPLLTGGTGVDSPGTHDWANILRQLGWLNQDIQIAAAVDFLGSALLVLSLLWGGIMLRIHYRNLVEKSH